MARYRKVDVRVHVSQGFLALTPIPPCGRGLWLYLKTCPESTMIPGLFRSGQAALAEALDWPLKAFQEAFQEISEQGMARADWRARVVYIPEALEEDPPQSPNVVTSWSTHWQEIPDCPLKLAAWTDFEAWFQAGAEERAARTDGKTSDPMAFLKAFRKACPKPSSNQEQEQIQKQTQEPERETPAGQAKPTRTKKAPETETASVTRREIARRVFAHYSDRYALCRQLRQESASRPKETDKSLDRLCELLKSGYSEEDLRKTADGMPYSKWNMGKVDGVPKLGVDRVYSITGKANHVEELARLAECPPDWAWQEYKGTPADPRPKQPLPADAADRLRRILDLCPNPDRPYPGQDGAPSFGTMLLKVADAEDLPAAEELLDSIERTWNQLLLDETPDEVWQGHRLDFQDSFPHLVGGLGEDASIREAILKDLGMPRLAAAFSLEDGYLEKLERERNAEAA